MKQPETTILILPSSELWNGQTQRNGVSSGKSAVSPEICGSFEHCALQKFAATFVHGFDIDLQREITIQSCNINWNQVPSSLSAIAIIIITYNDSSEFARTTQGPYHDSSWEGLSSNRLQEASNTRNYKNTFRTSMKKWTGVRKSEAIKCT